MHTEQTKLQLEKESIANKMAFLRNQISPHFFMNTLNNIHALVDINTDEAKASIIKLSQLMGYMLYDSQTSKVSVKNEIDFIESYVELMKLRVTEDVDIKFNVSAPYPMMKIPPLLAISFIENAFKYGISYEAPSYIHIDIDEDENNFSIRVINSIHRIKVTKKNSGIGIENARKRLDLLYGKNYSLSIKEESENIFNVNLNIPL
jgi:LytS/YehU family sensor histidine kinase